MTPGVSGRWDNVVGVDYTLRGAWMRPENVPVILLQMHKRTSDGLLQEVTAQITAEHVAKLAEAGLDLMLDPVSNASRD